jgi:hypothetical protein
MIQSNWSIQAAQGRIPPRANDFRCDIYKTQKSCDTPKKSLKNLAASLCLQNQIKFLGHRYGLTGLRYGVYTPSGVLRLYNPSSSGGFVDLRKDVIGYSSSNFDPSSQANTRLHVGVLTECVPLCCSLRRSSTSSCDQSGSPQLVGFL